MAVIGDTGRFDEKLESFEDYSGRLECFFVANQIPDGRQASTLIAVIGPEGFKLLRNLASPADPKDKTYAQLKALLKDHFQPAPIVIAERHKFWTASQGATESVSDFIVRLRNLSGTCGFGAFLKEALRDRLVSGLHPKMSRVQCRLLAVRDLDFEEAKKQCLADEMAQRANKEHMGNAADGQAEVNKLSRGRGFSSHKGSRYPRKSTPVSSKSTPDKCAACGSTRHRKEECKYRDAVCHRCKKVGHIRPVCTEKIPETKPRQFKSKTSKVHYVENDDDASESVLYGNYDARFGLHNTKAEHMIEEPYEILVEVGGTHVCMEFDPGSPRTTINESMYHSEFAQYDMTDADVQLRSYVGGKVPILGQIKVPVHYGNQTKKLDLLVVEGNRPSLFGSD